MPSPFPGMDPYLEQPAFWSAFHSRLLVAIADAIESNLNPQYYVEVETRTYLSDDNDSILVGIPDTVVASSCGDRTSDDLASETQSVAVQPRFQRVTLPMPEEIRERYLEIRELETGEVITAIEVLSPKNKRFGKGRVVYEEKRRKILSSLTHLIEIDLLRGELPMPILGSTLPTDYRILVSRSYQRPDADLYGFTVRDKLPCFPVPLKKSDPDVVVVLQEIFDGVYDRARYHTRIDYQKPTPPPALSDADRQWVNTLLISLRGGNDSSEQ